MSTAAELRAQAEAAAAEAKAAEDRAAELVAEARKAELRERREKRAAEEKTHFMRMFTEIGQPLAGLNEAQHGIVYGKAWEQGHASGYDEVESYYGDFAEMARALLDAR